MGKSVKTNVFGNLEALQSIIVGMDDARLTDVEVAGEETSAYKAVWNTTKNQLEAVVPTSKSAFLTHKQAFGAFVNALREKGFEATGRVQDMGGRAMVHALFAGQTIKDPSGSDVSIGCLLENNYARGSFGVPTFEARAAGQRHACSNSMDFKELGVGVFSGHFEKIADFEKKMLQLVNQIVDKGSIVKNTIEAAEQDAFENVDDMREVVYGLVNNRKLLAEIEKQIEPQRPLNRYTLYNAFTQYATFSSPSEGRSNWLQKKAQQVLMTPLIGLDRVSIPVKQVKKAAVKK